MASIITDRIELLKNQQGLTNKKFEDMTGLANGSVRQWINGRSNPSVEALIKIASVFNVSIDWLTGRTDQQYEIIEKTDDPVTDTSLTPDEKFIIDTYKKFDESSKFRLLQYFMKMKEANVWKAAQE